MRHFADWLSAYCDYAAFTEAPRRMHFWAGVSAIAGALRRRVYIDQFYFKWIPNFYIIFVAPPGVVSKSTTADTAINLLRELPGIHFGPDIVTWQALVTSFSAAAEQYLNHEGLFVAESAITCSASELGNLLDPADRELVDLLVTLWDNRKNLDKATKLNGSDHLANPSANIIGCTTPYWLQENVPQGVVGGGFTSRCIFVYAEEKEKLVALPGDHIPPNHKETQQKLIEDLVHISQLMGEYKISPEAKAWTEKWYAALWKDYNKQEEIFGNYIARKQTHTFKLAIVIAAAQRDELIILPEDLTAADAMLADIEVDMPKVFARMGRSEASAQAERFIAYVRRRTAVPYEEAYRYIHAFFPDVKDFEGIVSGAIRAGYMELQQKGDKMYLVAKLTSNSPS